MHTSPNHFFLERLLKLPSSRGHDYGWHLKTELGREVKSLQTRFENQHKKRRPTEVLGFD